MSSYLALETLLGFGRIAFGIFFIAKLYVSYQARDLVWSHRYPKYLESSEKLGFALLALIAVAILFTLGLFTGPASLILFLGYLYLYRFASLFGLEDVAFQHVSFYFVFAGSGLAISLDSYLGIGLWDRVPKDGLVPELFMGLAVGTLFLTAGVEKLFSPMWRSGLATYFFFWQPQFRRLDISFLLEQRTFLFALHWAAISFELLFLPALLFYPVPLGLICWFLAFGFVTNLWLVFILTWIGECMTVGLLVLLWLIFELNQKGLLEALIEAHASLSSGGMLVYWSLTFTILCGLITALVPRGWSLLKEDGVVKNIYISARYVSRFTWGLLPLPVFTEHHMEGPVVYRVFAEFSGPEDKLEEKEVFRIFSPDCTPGPERPFRPAFFEVTSYKVAEACMEIDAEGRVYTEDRRKFIRRLGDYILKSRLNAAEKADLVSFRFIVKQIVPPKEYAGDDKNYLESEWRDAFRLMLQDGLSYEIEPLSSPILFHPTGRQIKRLSFEFNPLAA